MTAELRRDDFVRPVDSGTSVHRPRRRTPITQSDCQTVALQVVRETPTVRSAPASTSRIMPADRRDVVTVRRVVFDGCGIIERYEKSRPDFVVWRICILSFLCRRNECTDRRRRIGQECLSRGFIFAPYPRSSLDDLNSSLIHAGSGSGCLLQSRAPTFLHSQ